MKISFAREVFSETVDGDVACMLTCWLTPPERSSGFDGAVSVLDLSVVEWPADDLTEAHKAALRVELWASAESCETLVDDALAAVDDALAAVASARQAAMDAHFDARRKDRCCA